MITILQNQQPSLCIRIYAIIACVVLLALYLFRPHISLAQESPNIQPGLPSFTPSLDSDGIDNINLITGNLSIKIPLVSYPQVGDKLEMSFYYYFDSPIITGSMGGDPNYDVNNNVMRNFGSIQFLPFRNIGSRSFPTSGITHNQYLQLAQQPLSFVCPDQDCPGAGSGGSGNLAGKLLPVGCMGGYATSGDSNNPCQPQESQTGAAVEGFAVTSNSNQAEQVISETWQWDNTTGEGPADAISFTALQDYLVEGDGASHTYTQYSTEFNLGQTTALTADGSGYLPLLPSGCSPTWSVCAPQAFLDRNGVKYTFKNIDEQALNAGIDIAGSNMIDQPMPGQAIYQTNKTVFDNQAWLEDRTDPNGNSIVDHMGYWVDTIGRNIPHENTVTQGNLALCSNNATIAKAWTVPGINGGSMVYTECYAPMPNPDAFAFTYSYGWSDSACNTNCPSTSQWVINFGVGPSVGWNQTVPTVPGSMSGFLGVTDLVLPNGSKYSFTYNTHAELASVTLPTGGSIAYQYESMLWDVCNPYAPVNDVITQRTVNDANGNIAVWKYQWSADACASNTPDVNVMVTVTDPYNNDTVHQHIGNYPVPSSSLFSYQVAMNMYQSGIVTETENSYSGTGSTRSLVKTITTTRPDNPSPFYLPKPLANLGSYPELYPGPPSSVKTQWADGKTSLIQYTYLSPGTITAYNFGINCGTGQLCGNEQFVCQCVDYIMPSIVSIYDYGTASSGQPGSLLRTTSTKYLFQTASNGVNYLAANLFSLPSSVVVQDASGNKLSETDYGYDEPSSPQGQIGNLTSISRWLNTSPNNPSISRAVYNSQGMLLSVTDPDQHMTKVIGFQCSGLFPQVVSIPYGDPTTVQETMQYVYDCTSGKMTSSVDPTIFTTDYFYADPLERLTSVVRAIGVAGAENSYTASYPSMNQVNTSQDQQFFNDGVIKKSEIVDGMGRPIMQIIASDPQSADYKQISYDLMGRVYQKWNPTRCFPVSVSQCGSEATWDISTSSYDAIGRTIRTANSDGTSLSWNYTDNVIDFYDEANNHWQKAFDALGRLTTVLELGNSLQPQNLETNYQYDGLNNLLKVTQTGAGNTMSLVRSFTYDSLSRLITATNPETATICYGIIPTGQLPNASNCTSGYDANGNLLYKTDSRGFTTSYVYDGLNRLLRKSSPVVGSSGSTNAFFATCYQYDTLANAQAGANLTGHLTAEWTQAGNSCASAYTPSLALTGKLVLSYDAMGRPLQSQQCVLGQCQTVPFTQSQRYDLAGDATSWTDGRGTMAFDQYFDSAARVSGVSNSLFGGGLPDVLFSVQQYNPLGSLQNWNIGNYLNISRSYDARSRVTGEAVTH